MQWMSRYFASTHGAEEQKVQANKQALKDQASEFKPLPAENPNKLHKSK